MTDTPEFSRLIKLDSLSSQARAVTIEAGEAELAALAARFDLVAVERLKATVEIVRDGEAIDTTGRLSADVVQSCVASAEPVPAHIDEAFQLRFVPDNMFESTAEEVELSESDCDVVGYSGSAIDLGEAVAETLALALDPFPRSPNADATLREAGVLGEEDAGPFSALKALKEKLGKA